MSIQLSTAVRNARLDAIEATVGTAALLRIYSGSIPANPAASETGTKLVEYSLASDWAANASSGAKTLNGLTLSVAAVAGGSGTAATHFRIYDSGGTTCHMQGTLTATGGGGDMTIDNTSISTGQIVNVTGFTLTDGNA